MRGKILAALTAALLLTVFAAVCVGATNDSGPSVFFLQTRHEFSPVLYGTKVVHEFVIQNKGTAILKVERVKTG